MQLLPVVAATAKFISKSPTPQDTFIKLSVEIWHGDIIDILESLRNGCLDVPPRGDLRFEVWVTDLLCVPLCSLFFVSIIN